MNDNSRTLFVIAIVVAMVLGLCCMSGLALFGFSRYRQTREASAPVYPYPQPMPMPPPLPPPSMPPTMPSLPPTVAPSAPGVELTVLPTSPVRGPATAPVTMHILSDFQCPFCSRVLPTIHELMTQYEGRVRFVWHDYPLPFHANAMPAAEAAQEVHRQLGDEAFWRFHDLLFQSQSDLSRPALERLASQLPGLDLARFRTALDTHEHEQTIRNDMVIVEAAHPSGLGTPSFSINGTWVSGAQPIDRFRQEIDRALATPH